MRFRRVFNLVFFTGLAMGILAAAAQAFFRLESPVAYGICLLGHPRDFTVWVANGIAGTDWPALEVFAIYPALTVIGVVVGSFIAANRNSELKLRPGPVRSRVYPFVFGFLVINLGLFWGSCPIRTGLLASYGNIMAVIVLVSIAFGVFLAVQYVRFRVRRDKF
ncbi:cytochrome C [Candidatus Pacearchaeota archaeon]|nr:cytochrome C [Candidatus Pacearchaeota archaeon]